jgi:hypothetical protein
LAEQEGYPYLAMFLRDHLVCQVKRPRYA